MKKHFLIPLTCVLFFFSCNNAPEGYTKSTFKVWGNCGMCKETIESSLKKDGISSAEWNKETKIIDVTYDPKKYDLDSIQSCIAAAGYDTQNKTGDSSAYTNLHSCCQYERKEGQ
ncbi:MAG: heavy-metal-associated domain-containing protein [Bacteroidia bacterium]|nr:heavy-metal-associated domain-containing protein [Bacteroidia bacterium]